MSAGQAVEQVRKKPDTARRSLVRGFLDWLSSRVLVALAVAVAVGELGRFFWVADLFSHFQVQYLIVAIGCLLASVVTFRLRRAAVACLICCFVVVRICPIWISNENVIPSDQNNLRLISMNLFAGNHNYSPGLAVIRESDADVVVLQEVTSGWAEQLKLLSDVFPHVCTVPRDDAFGIAVLSRSPLRSVQVRNVGEVPWIEAEVGPNDAPVFLVAAHTLPPMGAKGASTRREQFQAIEDSKKRALARELPLVVAGDLNCSPWSAHMRDLLGKNELKNARDGFGLNASWPVRLFVLRIPIDHVLVDPAIKVLEFGLLEDVSSDHFPIIADLIVPVRESVAAE